MKVEVIAKDLEYFDSKGKQVYEYENKKTAKKVVMVRFRPLPV